MSPEREKKLFIEPFVKLISISNLEACRCSNFVEFEGKGELDAIGVTRMEKGRKSSTINYNHMLKFRRKRDQ